MLVYCYGSIRERLKQNTLNFAGLFCAAIKNFLAFTAYFFALPQTRQHGAQTYNRGVAHC